MRCYITLNFSPLKAPCQHACANSATQIVEVYLCLFRCSRTKLELFLSAGVSVAYRLPGEAGGEGRRVLSSITAVRGPVYFKSAAFLIHASLTRAGT